MKAIVNTHFAILGLLLTASMLTALQDPVSPQINTEIARLKQIIKDTPIADKDVVPVAKMAEDSLDAASAALHSGQTYLALEKLGLAEDLLQGARAADNKAPIEKGGQPAFQSQWNTVSLRLTALDKDSHSRKWTNTPLAVRALAEAAQGRAIPLLEGGQGFAVATKPTDGLLYVGEAQGEADFAVFLASLTFADPKSPFPVRSLLPELQGLQTKTNAAFQPPKSIDLHSRFIALNSQLKLAQELDASRFYAGALYAYLEAVRHYGMLDTPSLNADQQVRVREDIATQRKSLAALSSDDSLAELFLQRAESYIAHSDGSVPSADEWRGARVIVDQVLHAYFAAKQPADPVATPSGKTVEITLVRWPYT
jgi:hypothetical protein